jgi:hypothetical protein
MVAVIAHYDGFYLDPLASNTYFSMVAYLEKRYHSYPRTWSLYDFSVFGDQAAAAFRLRRNQASSPPHYDHAWSTLKGRGPISASGR